MTTIPRAMSRATQQLAVFSDTPRLDAELLMAHALGLGRDRLILDDPRGEAPAEFFAYVERRSAGEPVAYITGRRAFWTIDLEVGPGALVPRPDSETLIAAAVEHFAGTAGPQRILDLGTGPGTLLLAALDEWPNATGIGVDASETALDYARRNAERMGLYRRAALRLGDWAEGIEERFDLVLCNPPYIREDEPLQRDVLEHEPQEALFAGPEGLDSIRRIAPEIPRLLASGGAAAVEIGAQQAKEAKKLLARDGLSAHVVKDLGGRDRAVILAWG